MSIPRGHVGSGFVRRLGQTRRTMGDGTIAGGTRLATPYQRAQRLRTMELAPAGTEGRETGHTVGVFGEPDGGGMVVWDTIDPDIVAAGLPGFAASLPTTELPPRASGWYWSLAIIPRGDDCTIQVHRSGAPWKVYDLLEGQETTIRCGVLEPAQIHEVEVTAGSPTSFDAVWEASNIGTPLLDDAVPPPLEMPNELWWFHEGSGSSYTSFNPETGVMVIPTDTNPGDVLLLMAAHVRGSNDRAGLGISNDPGPGWTQVEDQVAPAGMEDQFDRIQGIYSAWWKVAQPGDAGTYVNLVYTGAGSGFSASSKNLLLARIPGPSSGVTAFSTDGDNSTWPTGGSTFGDVEVEPAQGPGLDVVTVLGLRFDTLTGTQNPGTLVKDGTFEFEEQFGTDWTPRWLAIPEDGTGQVRYAREGTNALLRMRGWRWSLAAGSVPAPPDGCYVVGRASTPVGTASVRSVTIPSNVQAGDLLLAFVTHRETGETVTTGWSEYQRIDNPQVNSVGLQPQILYTRVAEAGDGGQSFTSTLPSSVIHGITLVAVRSSQGPLTVGSIEDDGMSQFDSTDQTRTSQQAVIQLTSGGPGRLLVFSETCNLSAGDAYYYVVGMPEHQQWSPPRRTDQRIMVATRRVGTGTTPSGDVRHFTATNHDGTRMALVIAP